MKPGFVKALTAQWSGRPAAEIEAATDALREDASAAGKLRDYSRNPAVRALLIEATRDRSGLAMILTLTAFLASTTVNVQAFLVGGQGLLDAWDGGVSTFLGWAAAWLVEIAITTGWVVLMIMEQVARNNGVVPDRWVPIGRWVALGVTWTFNVWTSVVALDPRAIVIHSTIPVLVFCFAEALLAGRSALTEAADKAAEDNRVWTPVSTPEPEREVPFVIPPKPPVVTGPEPAEETADPDVITLAKHPKGHLKNVRLPQVLRELLAEGQTRDTITTTEVDKRLPANKYVTRSMINSGLDDIEREEADDGAVNS